MNKTCTKCDESKPLDDFHRQQAGKFGRKSWCKACSRDYSREYNLKWRKDNAERKRKYDSQWRKANADRIREYNREWGKANIERVRRYDRKRYESRREYQRQWLRANPERRRESARKDYKANKAAYKARSVARNARKLHATPAWANQGYIKLFYKLAEIEAERTGRIVHVDHIVPLQGERVCGLHCEDNMQLLFAEDNIAKANKHTP